MESKERDTLYHISDTLDNIYKLLHERLPKSHKEQLHDQMKDDILCNQIKEMLKSGTIKFEGPDENNDI